MANPSPAVEGGSEAIASDPNHPIATYFPEDNQRNNAPSNKCFKILAITSVLVLGIYGLVGMSLNIYDLVSEEPHGNWPFNHRPAKTTLIILQSFLVVGFIFGGIGTWGNGRNWYFWACLDLLGTAAILTIFGIVTLHASRTEFEPKLLQALEKGGWDDFNWIDFIQHHHKCCGIESYSDWGRINEKLNPEDNGSGFHLNKDSLPASCCKREVIPRPNATCGVDAVLLASRNWSEFVDRFYVKPCGPEIIRPAREALIHLGLEMLVVAFLTLAVSLFLYCGATGLFCLAPKPQRRRGRQGRDQGQGRATNYNSNTEDDDDEDDDENENVAQDEASHSKAETKNHQGQDQDGGRNSGQSRRSRDIQRNIPGGDATKPKSKQKSVKGKQKQNKSLGKGGVDQVKGKDLATNGSASTSSRSKKKQNEMMANHKNKNNKSALAKGNLLNNNVPFGHHGQSSNRSSPSRTGGTRSDMILQKLEMLYEGVGKNVSTLSTTPNPSGALFFPWSNTPPPPPATTTTANTAPKLGGNKVKGHQLSHYSSVPHFPPLNQQPAQPHHAHHRGQWLLPSHCNAPLKTPTGSHLKEFVPLQPRVDDLPTPDKVEMVMVNMELQSHSDSSEKVLVEKDQGQDVAVSLQENAISSQEIVLDSKKSSHIIHLNIPGEVLLNIPVEATNAINLIHDTENVQKSIDIDPDPSPPNEAISEENTCFESTNSSTISVLSAKLDVDINAQKPPSESSLGFERSASSSSGCGAGAGESSGESEDDLESGSGNLSDGDLPTPRKSKARFSTLPTIVEEPEPNTPKKESPIGSEAEIKKNEVVQIGEEHVGGDVEEQISTSIANANVNVNVNVFGGG